MNFFVMYQGDGGRQRIYRVPADSLSLHGSLDNVLTRRMKEIYGEQHPFERDLPQPLIFAAEPGQELKIEIYHNNRMKYTVVFLDGEYTVTEAKTTPAERESFWKGFYHDGPCTRPLAYATSELQVWNGPGEPVFTTKFTPFKDV